MKEKLNRLFNRLLVELEDKETDGLDALVLMKAIDKYLEKEEDHQEVFGAIEKFETNHPVITETINEIMVIFNELGM